MVEPSLPVLVTRLPDRSALARLVRAALRHEIAHVVLAEPPRRSEAHTLDLRIADRVSLSLLAEPAGLPQDGHFPLRLRPLHRAQAAELYALLESESGLAASSGTVGTSPLAFPVAPADSRPAPRTLGYVPESARSLRKTEPLSAVGQPSGERGDPRRTAPLGGGWPQARGSERTPEPSPEPSPATPPPGNDPRRTVPAAEWEKLRRAALEAANAAAAVSLPPPTTQEEEPNRWFAKQQAEALPSVEPSLAAEAPDPTTAGAAPPLALALDLDEPSPPTSQDPPVATPPLADPFFDDALMNLPQLTVEEEQPAREEERPAREEENADGEDGAGTGPPPSSRDDEATLVRLPSAGALPPITSRTSTAHTPTEPAVEAPAGRRKPTTKLGKEERRRGTLSGTDPSLVIPLTGDPSLVGRRIADGKFVIESLIGAGAAGAVYRATHKELRRSVAIKVLHPHYQQDPHFMKSFRGEALAASQLDHPNVMRVLDFGQEPDGLVYIVMEYLSGRTLQSLLDEERRLPPDRALEIMIQVCAAVSVAHDNGIIHRDIKPDNIMLVPSRNDEGGTFELVKVCDFGIAALHHTDDAELGDTPGIIAGTPEYMSPEQAQGEDVDARADVYACGICLYELVTGRPPFLGETASEILLKQVQEVPRPPSQIIKGLDSLLEETILRAIQKDPERRQQSARELRVELKELLDPADVGGNDDADERSIVENIPGLDDPASGFAGFFMLLSHALTRAGRFERGNPDVAQAMKELGKSTKAALRGRSEVTFARRDTPTRVGFCVLTGHAEIVDLKRLLGSQLYGSHGGPFIELLVHRGIAALTLREGIPDAELATLLEVLHGPLSGEELRKELFVKPLRSVSVLFPSDVIGRDRKLSWKVGLTSARLARDLKALSAVRGISLKKMREFRDDLVTGVAHMLTKGEEVRQFLFNADLVDDAVENLRGFSAFQVWPLILERLLHDACADATRLLLEDFERGELDRELVREQLALFGKRLVTERSAAADEVVSELHRRGLVTEADLPRDLVDTIRATTLAEALVREPTQFLRALEAIRDPADYERELETLEAAMAVLARRGEAAALLAATTVLARHAKGQPGASLGPREQAAMKSMKSIIDKQRLVPIANVVFVGSPQQRDAARQLIVLAGSPGAHALLIAREGLVDATQRPMFVQVFRETGPAGWSLLSAVLPQMQALTDGDVALVEDLLRAMPERPDPVLADAAAKFLSHPKLAPVALSAMVPLLGDRAKKTLKDALEFADDSTRVAAITELRRLRAIDEPVVLVLERLIGARGSVGDELRAASAAALADAPPLVRPRVVASFVKVVEGKRGVMALLRGDTGEETPLVTEAMARALLVLDRQEGIRVLRARIGRAEGPMKARLAAILQQA